MAADQKPIGADDIERARAAVKEAAARDALGALCLDVLSRQAEGRTSYAGKKFAASRAKEHGVTSESAGTDAGNVLEILERGPASPRERALFSALAVAGFALHLEDDDADERTWKFVRHADWLEASGGYRLYAFLDALASDGAARVYRELAQAVVDDAAGREGEQGEVRARNALRLSALAASASPTAKAELRKVVSSAALDEPTRALASALAGDGREVTGPVPAQLSGWVGRAPGGVFFEGLRWVSGWAILEWLVRGIAYLLGFREAAELRLSERVVTVKTKTTMLGRVIREREETWSLGAIERAGREVRFPMLHRLVGVLGLSSGILLGGLVLFDGVRSGELVLISIAAVLLVLGAGLDLGLDVLWPGRAGRVSVDLRAASQRPLRLTSVSLEQADAFLLALRSALVRGAK